MAHWQWQLGMDVAGVSGGGHDDGEESLRTTTILLCAAAFPQHAYASPPASILQLKNLELLRNRSRTSQARASAQGSGLTQLFAKVGTLAVSCGAADSRSFLPTTGALLVNE